MSIQVDWLREGDAVEDGISSTATRVARVWSPSPAVALTAEDLPGYGTPHPDATDLVRASMQATREPAIGACIVTVNYILPVRGVGGDSAADETPFDTLNDLGRIAPDVTTEEVAVSYPILRPKMVQTVGLDPNPSPDSRLAWEAIDAAALVTRTTYTVRAGFRMTTLNTLGEALAAFGTVGRQSGKLHIINGRVYRFRIRMINPASEGDGENGYAWNAEYSWTEDPGVPLDDPLPDGWQLFTDSAGNDDYRVPALLSPFIPNTRFCVPPWSDVLTGPLELEDASLTEPEFFARSVLRVDASGHLSLPGVPA